MAKNRKRKLRRARRQHAEELFSVDGGSVSRYGKVVSFQTDRTPDEQEALNRYCASKRPEVVEAIQGDVKRAREIISTIHPEQIMNLCYWQSATARMGKISEFEYTPEEEILSTHLAEYVQSVIVSTPIPMEYTHENGEIWDELKQVVQRIYLACSTPFCLADSAARTLGKERDEEYEAFRFMATQHFMTHRGDRYMVHDVEFLRDFLTPHDQVLQDEYGMTAEAIVESSCQIQQSNMSGPGELFASWRREHERFLHWVDMENVTLEAKEDYRHAMGRFLALGDNGHRRDMLQQEMQNKFLGTGLMDLQQISGFSSRFLEDMSYSAGEDTTFFAEGEKAGWPLRVLPINRRPFLKHDGKYYYFNSHLLADHLYRAIERSIRLRRSDYALPWKERQTEVSEFLPRKMLSDLLPGSVAYGSLQYKAPTGKGQRPNWCEVDGLVLFEETLFVIEVKSGAFTWTSPDDDFESHIKSAEALVAKPAKQAARLSAQLSREGSVGLFDEHGDPAITLRADDWPHIIPLSVTVDNIGICAHHAKKLGDIGVVAEPAISCSIDDLRICRDVFTSPALFTAYMHLRSEAEKCPVAHANDEMDHLSLFMAFGDYIAQMKSYVSQYGGEVRAWAGFTGTLDKFFASTIAKDDKPELNWPYCNSIISLAEAILQSSVLGRTSDMMSLLRLPPQNQKRLLQEIGRCVETYGESRKTACCSLPMSVFDKPVQVVVGANPQQDTDLLIEFLLHFSIKGYDSGNVIMVDTVDDGRPEFSWYAISQSDISKDQLARLQGETKERKQQIVQWRKTPKQRNHKCPCCSGKKFKKCCGR